MAWSGSTASTGTGPIDGNPGNYVVLESSLISGVGAPQGQTDDFTGATTGNAGRPIFGNWTGVLGSDGINSWMAWNGATATANTGPSAGNPGNYVVLESSPLTDPGGGGGTPTAVTYYESLDTGTTVVPGYTTNSGSGCTLTIPGGAGYNALLSTNSADLCASSYRYNNVGAGSVYSTSVFGTTYVEATTVDGNLYTVTPRNSGTYTIQHTLSADC
jgi:hypothetical protein